MKKTILAMIGILVLGWAVVQGQTSAETATTEQYVEKELFVAKWGNGDGEIGLLKIKGTGNLYGLEWNVGGPSSIGVDQQGNIYILDPTNKRLNIYNSQGRFLREIKHDKAPATMYIEEKGNIFFFWSKFQSSRHEMIKVSHYDNKGNMVGRYKPIKGKEMGWDFYLENDSFFNSDGEIICKIPKEKIYLLGKQKIRKENPQAYKIFKWDTEKHRLIFPQKSGHLEELVV